MRIAAIVTALVLTAGCSSPSGEGVVSVPAGDVSHGYETEAGSKVIYTVIETEDPARGGSGDYSDRAVAN